MRMNSKLWMGAFCAVLLQTGASLGDSTTNTTTPPTNQTSQTSPCPKGQVQDKDGVCVAPKPGQMGFDLAAPSDDDSSSSKSSGNGSRDVGNDSSSDQKSH